MVVVCFADAAEEQELSPSERKVLEEGMERMLENLDEELLSMVDFLCKQQSRKLSIPLLSDMADFSEQYGKNWIHSADEALSRVTILVRSDHAFNTLFDKVARPETRFSLACDKLTLLFAVTVYARR